jgi:RNA polymerase sigma factor (sigma-70 family)
MTSSSSTTFWQNAYQNHAPKLLGVCRRYVNDLNVAQDLLHDAFITAIQKQGSFANKGAFEGWLSRIVVNTVLMHLRKDKKWTQSIDNVELIDEENEQEVESQSTKSLILSSDFCQEDLLFAIDQLPIHHKTVFNLYVFENYPHKQIAETLQISAGTSKSHLARARKKIQEILLQKALEMKKKERKMAFFPFFTSKNNYLDDLYKSKLGDLQIAPKSLPSELGKLMQQPQNQPIVKSFFIKKIFLWSTIFVLTSAIPIYFYSKDRPHNKPVQRIVPLSGNITEDNSPKTVVPDFSQEKKESESQKNAKKSISKSKNITPKTDEKNENIEKQTIIVKKQVIKKDTVIK